MEFKYSEVVDPSTYETQGLCDGLPVRYHKNSEIEEIDCLRCQEHWRELVGPLGLYKGGLGNPFNGMSIAIPEALPERLGIVSYANELAFLHDENQGDEHNDDLKAAFDQVISTGTIKHSGSGKRALQAYVAKRMLSIDKERALTTLKAWSKFLDKAGRQEDHRFKSEAEYLKYRVHDVGMLFWYGLLTFAQAISIPEDELDVCHQLASTAYIHMALVNDLVSWQKEFQSAKALGKDYVTNYVFVAMEEHGLTEEQAEERCRSEIRKAGADYLQIFEDAKARNDLSHDTMRYLECVLYSMSGNVAWSFVCPRYYTHVQFTERQLNWMKNGIPKEARAGDGSQVELKKPNGTANGTVNGAVNGNGVHAPSGDLADTGLLSAVITEHLKGREGFRLGDHDKEAKSRNGHKELDATVLQAPYEYITALPSKGLREQAIDALNGWFKVPAEKLNIIKEIITILHNASLMLDDLEDGSELRRGHPSTHCVFGTGQTINSANYQLIRALQRVYKLGDPRSLLIFTEELHNLYVGQSMDLYWTNNLICPSVNDYFKMVEHKTGGLFRLFGRLMAVHSTVPVDADLVEFSNALGRYFQTRDDYQNLVSAEYTKQKGFCEDLEEGKFSLPLIHLLGAMPDNYVLKNIWMQRRVNRTASHAQKETILSLMKKSGSLRFTLDTLGVLYNDVEKSIADLESQFGHENFQLRLIVELLRNG
ncbi:putative geranylgeranyl diphosphate synthase [Aspergillus aurantiobrunneus]